jgi:hypothetical protein
VFYLFKLRKSIGELDAIACPIWWDGYRPPIHGAFYLLTVIILEKNTSIIHKCFDSKIFKFLSHKNNVKNIKIISWYKNVFKAVSYFYKRIADEQPK